MSNVTIHHYSKTEKPISVNGRAFGRAMKKGADWIVFDNAGKEIGRASKVREIEFVVSKFFA